MKKLVLILALAVLTSCTSLGLISNSDIPKEFSCKGEKDNNYYIQGKGKRADFFDLKSEILGEHLMVETNIMAEKGAVLLSNQEMSVTVRFTRKDCRAKGQSLSSVACSIEYHYRGRPDEQTTLEGCGEIKY